MKSNPTSALLRAVAKQTWWTICIRLLLIALAACALVAWLDPALRHVSSLGLLWRNALPVALVALVVFGLFGRLLFSIWLTGGLAWIVFTVSAIKQRNMNMPLMPGDLALEHQVTHNLAFFAGYVKHGVWAVLGVIVVLLLTWIIWRLERRGARPSWITRVVWVLLPVALLYMMFAGVSPWRSVYSNQALHGFQMWSPATSVDRSGLMAGLVRMTQEAKVRIPKANKIVVRRFAKNHRALLTERSARTVPAHLPDIVVVQSEAFFTPSILKGVEPGQFAPNFTRLARTGISGGMLAPTYGGGTIRTEFETLTGYPIRAFPSVVYPYYGLAASWMPSVPRRLRAFGYTTTLFHPFLSSFYNRQEVMPELGFEHMYFKETFGNAKHAGPHISDHALFNYVLRHMNNKRGSAPQYVMAITMENHGPWDRDAGAFKKLLEGHKMPTGLSAAGKKQLTYYLSHLVNGDKALGDFAKKLMARKRWTILVFYGDHLPALDTAFKEIGFDDGKTHGSERTHYMLLSNRTLKPRTLNLDSYELPGLLFDIIGLPMNGYLAFDGAVRQAWVQGHFKDGPRYGQILYNAARLEVRCKRKVSMEGRCKRHAREHHVKLPNGTETSGASTTSGVPSLDGSCGKSGCSNGLLSVAPGALPDCGAHTRAAAVKVSWKVPHAKGSVVDLWIQGHDAGGPPTLWTRQAAPGTARTGKWVLPGTRIILTDASGKRKLSVLTIGATKCDR